jgi:hypothetical protein
MVLYANDDAVLPRTAEIPGENVGLGGRGRVHGSVGLRRLPGIAVWRWRLGGRRMFGIHPAAATYYILRALCHLRRCPDLHSVESQPPRTLKPPACLYLRLYPAPARARACPLVARPASGSAGAGVGSRSPRLGHRNRPHPSGGGDSISRRRGFRTLKTTRIASGRRRVPRMRILGGSAVFLLNNHGQTTTVGASSVRVIILVRP